MSDSRLFWAILLVVAACGSLEPIETRVPSRLSVDDLPEGSPVLAPDSVGVGQPFDVVVTTVGGGCSRQGDTVVSVTPDSAVIRPHDIRLIPREGTLCLGYLVHYKHVAPVSFATEGTKVIVVRGRSFQGDTTVVLRYDLMVE